MEILDLYTPDNIRTFHLVFRILSWAALAVTGISYFLLSKSAEKRRVEDDLTSNLIYAIIGIICNSRSASMHWWVVASPCLSIYLLMYPIRYFRFYFKNLMKFAYVGAVAILSGGYAIALLMNVYLPKFKLIAMIFLLMTCVAVAAFVWMNSSGHKCPKCKRYIDPIKIGERTDSIDTHSEKRRVGGRLVSRREEKNPYDNKIIVTETYEGGSTVVYDITERKYTEFVKCPICGCEHTRRDWSYTEKERENKN